MSDTAPSGRAEPGWPGPRDVVCIAVLALACLLLRVPSLDRIGLNPDECQYESTASYLVATGASAFSFPYGVPFSSTLYKYFALAFGPYPMYEVRLFVLLLCLTMAILLHETVRRESNRVWGLVAGLVFLHYSLSFEGLTANREWFSGFPVLVGVVLYLGALRATGTRRWWLLCVAGLACGLSIWYKRQASFLVLVVPAALIWQAWLDGRPREAGRRLVPYLLGGSVAAAGFVLSFALGGTLADYFGSMFADWKLFVLGNEAMTQRLEGGAPGMYLRRLYGAVPHRPILLVAYGFAAATLVGAARRLRRRGGNVDPHDRPTTLVFAVWIVAALLCVQLGNRFLAHYFLYLLPPAAGLFALAGHRLSSLVGAAASPALASFLVAALLVDRAVAIVGLSPAVLKAGGPASIIALVYLALLAAIAVYWVGGPRRRAAAALGALLFVETALLVVQAQRVPTPPSLPHHPGGFPALAAAIDARESPGDRLFVWGWLPEIYSLTRLEAATHITITQYVIDDYYVTAQPPKLNRPLADLLMRDLTARSPRFVVDASARSWTLVGSGDPWLYRLDLYPDFELDAWLRSEYARVGTFDGCVLYERRDQRVR